MIILDGNKQENLEGALYSGAAIPSPLQLRSLTR